jgi:hypothetical protein
MDSRIYNQFEENKARPPNTPKNSAIDDKNRFVLRLLAFVAELFVVLRMVDDVKHEGNDFNPPIARHYGIKHPPKGRKPDVVKVRYAILQAVFFRYERLCNRLSVAKILLYEPYLCIDCTKETPGNLRAARLPIKTGINFPRVT